MGRQQLRHGLRLRLNISRAGQGRAAAIRNAVDDSLRQRQNGRIEEGCGHYRVEPGRSPQNAYRALMSIFGRKTFKAGPIWFTLSRSGLSESIGTRRARVNINGKGRVRRSINFGRGLRWTK